ncbi:MAG TPA: DUF4286 family protein [Flavisolibacter sp.]|jgi:hypothetical protein|nr:DUF4286 family protein [Flavisolibacter sp.]
MIIYNVTVKTDNKISGAWMEWLLKEHIPEIMQTNCFTDFKVVRLLEVDDSDGPTHAIQYFAPTKEHYNKYLEKFAAEYRKKSYDKWGSSFVAFHSLMEVVK